MVISYTTITCSRPRYMVCHCVLNRLLAWEKGRTQAKGRRSMAPGLPVPQLGWWLSPHQDLAQRQQTRARGKHAGKTRALHTSLARCSHTALGNTNLGKTFFPISPLSLPFSLLPTQTRDSANQQPAQHQANRGCSAPSWPLSPHPCQDKPHHRLCLCPCLGATTTG